MTTIFERQWLVKRITFGSKKVSSVLISLLGDSVLPHGGEIALGSLVACGSLLGLSESAVRSAINRLMVENWLEYEIMGRKSFYRLSEEGKRRFAYALPRIYVLQGDDDWMGEWQLITTTDEAFPLTPEGQKLINDLRWAGYGALSSNVFLRPVDDRDEATESVLTQASGRLIAFAANSPRCSENENVREFAARIWKLDAVAARYNKFIDLYSPLLEALWNGRGISQNDAFAVRTYLAHDFRRIRLADPQLPGDLLPESWPAPRALYVAHEIYDILVNASESYIMSQFESSRGSVDQLSQDFYDRFGGLTR